MAGEIQLNSTTMATESSGSITAELDTIRPNTTNGSLTLQGDSSDAGVTGLTIDSSGNATFAQTIAGGTIGSSVVFPTYPSGSFFEANFYEAQSSDAVSEIWYKVPTECTLIAFQISAYHSSSHTAIAYVYTGTSAGSDTTQQWYKAAASTSGWVTWLTSDGSSGALVSGPVNLGGTSEHNFVGVRTTSSDSHGYWTKVTTTLRFRVD